MKSQFEIGTGISWWDLKKVSAPLKVRQNVYILDAHPKNGDQLDIPVYQGLQPFLYVMDGELTVGNIQINKMEAVTDLEEALPTVNSSNQYNCCTILCRYECASVYDRNDKWEKRILNSKRKKSVKPYLQALQIFISCVYLVCVILLSSLHFLQLIKKRALHENNEIL